MSITIWTLIQRSLGVSRIDYVYNPDLSLREDLGLDSLELAVLTVKIEAEFGVDVFADGVVTTVGDIEEKIRKHQNAQHAENDAAADVERDD